jgi:hypothetical protein
MAMPSVSRDVSKKTLPFILVPALCLLLALVFGIVSQAWAADSGVYGFICQKGDNGDYVLVVKNGAEAPDEGEYGTVVKAYPENLANIRTERWDKNDSSNGGWPWRATASTLDADAAAVKKVVVAGQDGSVTFQWAAGIFAYFTNCTVFDLTGFFAEGYDKDNAMDLRFMGILSNTYNKTTNNDITIILGSRNVVTWFMTGPPFFFSNLKAPTVSFL